MKRIFQYLQPEAGLGIEIMVKVNKDMTEKFGYVTQVIGPVVDVIFEEGGDSLPPIYEALRIERDNGEKLIVEVEQHIGGGYRPLRGNGYDRWIASWNEGLGFGTSPYYAYGKTD